LIYFIGKLLSETQGQNSIARVLNVSSNTVVNYFMRFHKKALEYNNWFLESRRFGLIQFDELNTFEHTKLKPVHIGLAVERTTRFILGTSVARAPYSHEKDLALRKYGPREDERKTKVEELFHHLCPHITEKAWIQMDKCSWYERVLKSVLPDVQYQKYKGRKPIEYGFNELKRGWDPLFSINHTCAMLRAHINRLARKTWCTTKKPERLQMHLDIYMMFHNMLILEALELEELQVLA